MIHRRIIAMCGQRRRDRVHTDLGGGIRMTNVTRRQTRTREE